MEPRQGMQIRNYTLEEYLGEGAFGEVWKATKLTEPVEPVITSKKDDVKGLMRPSELKGQTGQQGQIGQHGKMGASGQQGTVRTTRTNKQEFAIKIIPKGNVRPDTVNREIQNLKQIMSPDGCHTNLLCYQESWSDADNYYLVTQYLPGINGRELVQDILEGIVVMTDDQMLDLLFHLAEAIEVIHQQNLAHRDIKPENFQYNPETEDLTLIDFGLACLMNTTPRNNFSNKCDGRRVGTPYYSAPELINGRMTDEKAVDIFALGITFYYLLAGRRLFQGKTRDELERNILNNHHLLIRTGNSVLNQLIVEMINPNPRLRPNIEQVITTLANIPEYPEITLLSPV